MGILVERCGVCVVDLMACWSQKYQTFEQNMGKTLQNEALGKSGNKCLLRRFEACPRDLISIINIILSYVLIYVCRLGRLCSFGGGRWKGFLLGCLAFIAVFFSLSVVPAARK